jgi:tungstate transport system substrate-binding protein
MCGPSATPTGGREVLAGTTTTTQDTGLTDALLEDFHRRSAYRVKLVVAGTGQILQTAARGELDVVLTHSPEAEEQFVRDGYGRDRRLVMHNDYLVLGPVQDPLGIRGRDSRSAFAAIAAGNGPFVSRGDQSGTHVKELALWSSAGVAARGRAWYVESSAGQLQTLQLASQRRAYVLADRGTWLANRALLDLVPLVEGGRELLNIYHVMVIRPERFPKVNHDGARAFADYLVSVEGQALIAGFGVSRFGQPLFVPDAGRNESELR